MSTSPTWPTFLTNCALVHTLDSNPTEVPIELNDPSLHALYMAVEHNPLFPQLRSLRVMNNSLQPFFMSSSVKELVWVMDEQDRPSTVRMRYRVDHILEMMPGITHLSIVANCLRGQFDADLVRLFSGLQHLQNLRLTRHTLSPSLFYALTTLRDLSKIEIIDFDDQTDPIDGDLLANPPDPSIAWKDTTLTFERPSFQSLHTLCIGLPDLDLARTLFHEPYFAISQLYCLRIFIAHPEQVREAHIRDFFVELVRVTPALQELGLSMLFPLEEELDDHIAQTIDNATYATLEPLLCLKLVWFVFEHTRVLDITDADVEVMAQSWPTMRFLSLNRHPVVLHPSQLTVRSIASFARWCPCLEFLGIYINGERVQGEVEDVRLGSMMKSLHLGASSFPYKGSAEAWMLMAEQFSSLLSQDIDVLSAGSNPVWDMEIGVPLSSLQVGILQPAILKQYDHSWQVVKEMADTFRWWDSISLR